jgi:hypothetical protein
MKDTNLKQIFCCKFMYHTLTCRSRDSNGPIGWTSGVRFQAEARDYSFLQCPDWLWDPLSLLPNRTGAPSPDIKRPGRGAEHSTSSNADVKNGEAQPRLPLTSS